MENAKLDTCWYCGHLVDERGMSRDHYTRAFHADCADKFQAEQDKRLHDYLAMKTQIMYQRAIREMERQQTVNINDYYDEAQVVHDMATANPEKFDSSDEMMAAIELVHNRIHAKVQSKVGKYRVDFLLPDMHCALEIDGVLHEFKIRKDSVREIAIMDTLNKDDSGWEVIRIPTKYIEKDITKLVPAIKALYEKRQALRRQHDGFLPASWSRTNTAAHIQAAEGLHDRTAKNMDQHLEDGLKEL